MYKNHNNEKNSPAPYLIGKKKFYPKHFFTKDMRKWKSHFFFDHPLFFVDLELELVKVIF